jgi:hypothetical protein
MSHDDRRNPPTRAPVVPVDIAPTDSAGLHSDQQFILSGRWSGDIKYFQPPVFRKYQGSHSISFLISGKFQGLMSDMPRETLRITSRAGL